MTSRQATICRSSTYAPDLRSDGLVSQSATGSSLHSGAGFAAQRCGAVRDGRLRGGSGGWSQPGSNDARKHRGEAARVFTGLSADYLRRADLRVSPDEFRQELLRDRGLIVGGTDTRFEGHTMDRMSRQATYDPSDAAIGSAYVSSFNDYVRRVLKYGDDKSYRPSVDDIGDKWSFVHVPPDASDSSTSDQGANVIPDLAHMP
jgi:hypothetical protein